MKEKRTKTQGEKEKKRKKENVERKENSKQRGMRERGGRFV